MLKVPKSLLLMRLVFALLLYQYSSQFLLTSILRLIYFTKMRLITAILIFLARRNQFPKQ
jgi:hypothetical protein